MIKKLTILVLLLAPLISYSQDGIGTSSTSSFKWFTDGTYRGQIDPSGRFYFGNIVNHNNETLQDSGKSYFNGDMQVVGNLLLNNSVNTINIGTTSSAYSSLMVGFQAGLSSTAGFCIGMGRSVLSGASNAPRQNSIGFQNNQNPSDADNCTFGSYVATMALGANNSLFGNYVAFNAANDVTYNSAVGMLSLYMLSHGSYNSTLGGQAGYSTTTGSNNTFTGYQAGYYNTTGSRNLYEGNGAGGTSTNTNDSIDIAGVFEGKRQSPYTGASIIGGIRYSFISRAGNYTLTASDHIVEFTSTAIATLPSMTTYGINPGQEFVIINADIANVITITPSSGSINQLSSIVTTKYRTTITYDGTNYYTD